MTTVSAVSSTAERLDYLLLAEGAPARCEGDLRDRVVQLRSEMDLLENKLVADEDGSNKIRNETKQNVTQLAYDIEDAVESYTRGQTAAETKWNLGGALQCVLKYPTARSLRKDLHTFSRRIDELKNVMAVEAHDAGERSVVETPQNYRPPGPDILSGEEDVSRLTELLTGELSKLSTIAVCGMGGIGKTTLVRLVYNKPLMMDHFEIRAWAYVGPDFQARNILESILLSLGFTRKNRDEIAGMETMELVHQLYKIQKHRRYLLVLDDIWSSEAWDTLSFAFPDDNNGSKIVITTRRMDLANQIARFVLQMRPLSEEQSWQVLKSKSGLVSDSDMQINMEKEIIGRKIARYCGGLPLAITVVASTLRRNDLAGWEDMLRILARDHNFQETQSILDVLSFSYTDLTLHLKPCFLYLGHFPQNEAIPVEKLYLLWMAEGLISMRTLNGRTQMEAAEIYLQQLVDRNLVFMVENEVSDPTKFKSCQLHDMIRSLCILKGQRDSFFDVIDFGRGDNIRSSSRRLAIYLNKFEDTNDNVLLNIRDVKNIRSILFYDRDESHSKPTWPREVSDLTEFQAARVLDFYGVDFRIKKIPRGIHKLMYLRHLSFRRCYLQVFPSSFSNFYFLETLDLRVRVSCVMTIPNILWKIPSLRHLYFPLAFRGDTKDKLKLDTLKKLQVLENFNASLCDANDLPQLENLQILTGTVESNMDLKNIIGCMNSNKFLRHSSLEVKNFDSYSKERLEIVAALLECNALHNLDFEGYLGMMPPHRSIGSNLTSVVFNGSEFSEDPIPILGKFPNLRSLALSNDAFMGKKMVWSEPDHFPRLESLKLANLQYLEEWQVEEAAMPSLIVITIEQCDKLEVLPYGLSEIPTLQRLMIGSMPNEFREKVYQIMKERRDMGNETLTVTFYDC